MAIAEQDVNRLLRRPKEDYGPEYTDHLFQQYKLCIEMADRVSSRRMLANSFFLAVHTAIVTAFAVLISREFLRGFSGLLPFIAAILLCVVWWFVLRSYRQLNTGKFKIVLALEQLLPTAPYDEEWKVLAEGKDRQVFWIFGKIERWVPAAFGLLYLLLGLATLHWCR
ncbi:MAG: hypothetical protein JW941_10035 [Candidatus Coatesbacteria bacterium]|nr:hypothetical protein [Candidatus Coatesbacteria bacterium]